MIVAQVEGCSPIVRAWKAGADSIEPWENPAETAAYGLAVPVVGGGALVLEALRKTGGEAVAVPEGVVRSTTAEIAKEEGLWSAPEGGAAAAAALLLLESGSIEPSSRGVVFLTASGLKY